MATFIYKAINHSGKEISGQAVSSAQHELSVSLKKDGLYLISCREIEDLQLSGAQAPGVGQKPSPLQILFRRLYSYFFTDDDGIHVRGNISVKTLATITWQISIALKSGITLSEILATIAREAPDKKVRFIFDFFNNRVTSGHTLSESLAIFPSIFTPIYVNMVLAGETGGFLPQALEEAATYLKKQDRLNKKIKSMMIYPIVLTTVATSVIIFMATFIMPVFVQVFADMNAPLPLLTKILVYCFALLRDYLFFWLGLIGVLLLFVRRVYGQMGKSLSTDAMLLRVPFLGELLMKVAIARFLGTLGVLLKTNVNILDSIEIGKAVAGNAVLALEIDAIYKAVKSGKPMAEKMARSKCFPSMVTMMVSNGEQSGNLPESLEKVTEYYVEEVDLAVSDTLAVMEPLIVVFMGVLVALVASGLLMPIFDLPGFVE